MGVYYEDKYPTEEELERVKNWDTLTPVEDRFRLALELINYIKSIWWAPDWGFILEKRKKKYVFVLHTGGWSGNEDIVEALQENRMFWRLYWKASRAGGHFYFEIPLIKYKYEKEDSFDQVLKKEK